MIIYGTKTTQLAKETCSQTCSSCGTQNNADLYVFQNYAHVFWIPLFPIGKTGVAQCGHCKKVLRLKEMSPTLKMFYDNLRSNTKTPVWTFSGMALIALFVVSAIVSDQKKDQRNAALILAPKAGDIFEIKTEANQYT